MKINKISLGAVVCALALSSTSVQANPTVYTLDDPNADLTPYPGAYGSVSVNLVDITHATITFTANTSGGYIYLFGANGMADVNLNATSFSVSVSAPGTAQAPSSGNISEFGNFNVKIDNDGGNANAVNSVIFSVVNISGTWADSANVLKANSDGYFAAAHIFVRSPTGGQDALVTGYAGNGTTTRNVPDGGSTAMLLGMGLLGLGWLRRNAFARN